MKLEIELTPDEIIDCARAKARRLGQTPAGMGFLKNLKGKYDKTPGDQPALLVSFE
jgi:hypothetical protein